MSRIRAVGLTVLVVWAVWWFLDGVSAALSGHLPPWDALARVLFPGGVFVLSAALAWRNALWGGVLVFLEGAAVFLIYPLVIMGIIERPPMGFLLTTMAFPPILSANLILYDWSVARKKARERGF